MSQADDGGDGRKPTNANKRAGTMVEQRVAAEWGGERLGHGWYDVDAPGEPPIEVKSTLRRLNSGRRGRYQIEPDNHRNLLDHGGRYVFVLLDSEPESVQDVDRERVVHLVLDAEEVEAVRQDRDLKHPDGGKLKLPWSYLHDMANVPGESA